MNHRDCAACPVARNGACDVARDHLAALAVGIRVRAGDMLAEQDSAAGHVTLLRSGAVKLHRTAADGWQQIVGFAMAGDLIGLTGSTHAASAQALQPVLACRVPRPALDSLVDRSPALARFLIGRTGTELATAQAHMTRLGRRSALGRTASLLLDLAARQGISAGPLPVRISRTDMAAYLGITLESASRSMSQLRRSGAVSDARELEIADRSVLERMAA